MKLLGLILGYILQCFWIVKLNKNDQQYFTLIRLDYIYFLIIYHNSSPEVKYYTQLIILVEKYIFYLSCSYFFSFCKKNLIAKFTKI